MIIALCVLLTAIANAAAIYWLHRILAAADPVDYGELRLTAVLCMGCRGVFCVPVSLLSNVRACPLCRGDLLHFEPDSCYDLLAEFVEHADTAAPGEDA